MTADERQFIENLFQSLEREVHKKWAGLKPRWIVVSSRLTPVSIIPTLAWSGSAALSTGDRAIAKMIEWTERTDVTLGDVLRRQTELEQRVSKLESAKGNNGQEGR